LPIGPGRHKESNNLGRRAGNSVSTRNSAFLRALGVPTGLAKSTKVGLPALA
jgi:hypothetical protein